MKDESKCFLNYNNYYFKLKSYARNYYENPLTNQYYNLDFAYLIKLSKLDMFIWKIILELSLWNIVKLMSFENFIELYELYYQTYKLFNYTVYLKSIKFNRNAAAHNSCILSTMRKPNSQKQFRITKIVWGIY